MIVITGASDGLGKELAKLYQEKGKTVVNVSRRKSEYATINISADLTKGIEIEKAANEIKKINEPLEALINCAGVLSFQKLGQITEDEVKRVMATNVKHPILLVSNLYQKIVKDAADIINVSSTVGAKAYEDQAVYGSSKWALRGFSQNLQLEFKNTQVRVISFCVGGFKSDIAKKITGESLTDPENWMNPEDVASFMESILSLPKNMEVSEVFINRKLTS